MTPTKKHNLLCSCGSQKTVRLPLAPGYKQPGAVGSVHHTSCPGCAYLQPTETQLRQAAVRRLAHAEFVHKKLSRRRRCPACSETYTGAWSDHQTNCN